MTYSCNTFFIYLHFGIQIQIQTNYAWYECTVKDLHDYWCGTLCIERWLNYTPVYL